MNAGSGLAHPERAQMVARPSGVVLKPAGAVAMVYADLLVRAAVRTERLALEDVLGPRRDQSLVELRTGILAAVLGSVFVNRSLRGSELGRLFGRETGWVGITRQRAAALLSAAGHRESGDVLVRQRSDDDGLGIGPTPALAEHGIQFRRWLIRVREEAILLAISDGCFAARAIERRLAVVCALVAATAPTAVRTRAGEGSGTSTLKALAAWLARDWLGSWLSWDQLGNELAWRRRDLNVAWHTIETVRRHDADVADLCRSLTNALAAGAGAVPGISVQPGQAHALAIGPRVRIAASPGIEGAAEPVRHSDGASALAIPRRW